MTHNNHAITQVDDHIYYLDSRKVNEFGVSGIYLIVGDGITLVETGTALVAPDILDAVEEIGFKKTDIKHVIVTHIHLDHAGGTGWLVSRLPNLKVYVHERGAKHLHDPTALIESAKMVYGDIETIKAIHGEILPIPKGNLFPVKRTNLDIGANIMLNIFDAPGHASHHICISEPKSGCLFSGEALGHNYPEEGILQPAVAPPGFDYEASIETINFIENLKPKNICFSQFGQRRDVSFVIKGAKNQLKFYYALVLNRFKEGLSVQEVINDIIKQNNGMYSAQDHLSSSMLVSIVTGYQVYFKRKGLLG